MITRITIDDDLLAEAQLLGKHKTKKEAVRAALVEYIQRRKRNEVLSLFGKVKFHSDYDYKKLRRKR
ncbi:MAG: type II toxin-antitoxin system VapB family antitoxin [Planctomycetota bacterium]